MRLFILSLLFFPFVPFAQKSNDYRVGFQIGMNRMDFQVGATVKFDRYTLKPYTSLEIGVNRTIFQNRLFPRLSVGTEYCILKGDKVQFGPQFSYSCSLLKVMKTSKHINQYNEVYGGLYVCYGKKVQFKTALLTGWQNERYFSTFSLKKEGVNSLGFSLNFGVNYAF